MEDEELAMRGSDFAPSNSVYALKRARVDSWATGLYVVLVAFTVVGSWSIFSGAKTQGLPAGFYENSLTCNVADYQASMSHRAAPPPPATKPGWGDDELTFIEAFERSISVWLPLSAVFALSFSVGYVLLFRRFAEKMVFGTIIASLGFSLLFGIVAFAVGAVFGGIIILITTLIMAVIYYFIRAQLRQCAQLLGLSGKALCDLPQIATASLLNQVAGTAVLIYMFAAMVMSIYNSSPVTNYTVVDVQQPDSSLSIGTCYDATGYQVSCCSLALTGWATFYLVMTNIVICWTVQLILQLKLYIIADTVAQWYWAPPGAQATAPSVRVAARHALTSSFGSVAFAALVVALIQALRNMLRRQARENIICCIINCIAQPLLELAEMFTRFTTIACAITGKPFVQAGKDLFAVLKRNFLPTFTLWWVPDMVLHSSSFLFSLCWAVIVYFSTYLQYKGKLDDGDAVGCAFAVSAVAFGIVLFVLYFMASMLLDIVNSLYICWSLDRDSQRDTHPEISMIYQQVPTIQGALIEHPDASLAYGAPMQQQAPFQQQPSYTPAASYPPTYPAQQQAYTYGYPAAGTPSYPAVAPASAYPPASSAYPPPAYPPAQPAYGGPSYSKP